MKIASISDAIYPFVKGGAEKRNYEISMRLAKRGHQVHIFGIKWWQGERIIEKDGVFLHGVCKPSPLYYKGRRSIKQAISFSYHLFPYLIRERFDIIDCYQSPILHCYPVKIASIWQKTPLIFTWHEVWRDYWLKYLGPLGIIARLLEKGVVMLPDSFIVPSVQTQKDMIAFGHKEREINVVLNGIDYDRIQSIPPSPEESDLISVSRLIKEKNIDMLLRAVALLRDEFPELKASIIGDGPERISLERLTDELGIRDNVKFWGFLEDFDQVVSLMKSSAVLVHPSTREGAGIVLLEANACGLPVIAVKHKQGISEEFLKMNYNGFFVELSPEAIAHRVRLILTDNELRSTLKANSISFAQRFDWDLAADLVEEVYKQTLRDRGKAIPVQLGDKE